MRRVLISLFWNPARTARSCWYPEGEIVKSDKSPSQIRNSKFQIGRKLVQLQISDLGFKMQESSDFKFSPSIKLSRHPSNAKFITPVGSEASGRSQNFQGMTEIFLPQQR